MLTPPFLSFFCSLFLRAMISTSAVWSSSFISRIKRSRPVKDNETLREFAPPVELPLSSAAQFLLIIAVIQRPFNPMSNVLASSFCLISRQSDTREIVRNWEIQTLPSIYLLSPVFHSWQFSHFCTPSNLLICPVQLFFNFSTDVFLNFSIDLQKSQLSYRSVNLIFTINWA